METREATRLFKDEQGIYHWVYRLPMFRNFSILRTLLKAMMLCFVVVLAIPAGILIQNHFQMDNLWLAFGIPALVCVVVLIITILCYFLVAYIYGGYYVAIYSMDEEKIAQYQPRDQAEKSKMIGLFSAAAGALDGNWGLVAAGVGMTGALVVETPFVKIRSLKIFPQLNEIRVHSFLTWYTIYVCPEDFQLVAEYMESRSVNARIVHH